MHIAVLGCGNMGTALVKGLMDTYGDVWRIRAYDKDISAVENLGATVTYEEPSNWFEEDAPDIVLLAVKPQIMKDAVAQFKTTSDKTVWVSIAAGISMETLQSILPAQSKVCRVMPNTPALVGEALSAFTLSETCSDTERAKVEQLLKAVGVAVEVPESMMSAVTGLSGSGPAYVFTIIEALTEGAVAMGLPYQTALDSAVQTLIGSAKMVQETGEAPSVLRSRVMSPGGTTAAGIRAMEESGVRAGLMSAVRASAERADELG